MPFKIDYVDDAVLAWSTGPDASCVRDTGYTPTIYVAGDSAEALETVRSHLDRHGHVTDTGFEEYRTVWRDDPERVLELNVADVGAVTDVAHEIRGWGTPGEYRLFNVDFAREFRYCLEAGVDPTPADVDALGTLRVSVPPKPLSDGSITPLTVGETTVTSGARAAIEELDAVLAADDPDVLVVNSGEVIPQLYEAADRVDRPEFDLGRLPGWERLASASTYESYGRTGHSPARYNVPGRAIVDESNSFFLGETTLAGLLDLVGRSHKPLQETAWASIGNVLTSIQIRVALARNVLVPWNSWRHEYFKPMTTLHEADRGGFIFSPDVGIHEDVHELDFSSLYPNIMLTRNVSPDTIRCECHGDREDVPGLGYSICDEPGFITDVLGPIVSDRDEYKAEIRATTDDERARELRDRSEALKWILVSCFGYQGFSNAKFGRIECHEAINAFAREILLETKDRLEAHGWRVVHGIVDSVWVSAIDGRERTPLADVADEITDAVGITLEYEAHYDWIAFVPRRDGEEGALNRYFAKYSDSRGFKKRGIELRQRSTPTFVEDCQQELLEALDEHRAPEPVCDRLAVRLADLRAGRVDPADLFVKRRVSKTVEEYTRRARNVAALERAATRDFDISPGESVRYVVVDDEKRSQARVKLPFEDPDRYDADFYADLLIRAAENVLSPLGWKRDRIRAYLDDTEATAITAY